MTCYRAVNRPASTHCESIGIDDRVKHSRDRAGLFGPFRHLPLPEFLDELLNVAIAHLLEVVGKFRSPNHPLECFPLAQIDDDLTDVRIRRSGGWRRRRPTPRG